MVSDLEVFKAMIERAGIVYTSLQGKDNTTTLRIEEGYTGYASYVTFSENGALLTIEAGE